MVVIKNWDRQYGFYRSDEKDFDILLFYTLSGRKTLIFLNIIITMQKSNNEKNDMSIHFQPEALISYFTCTICSVDVYLCRSHPVQERFPDLPPLNGWTENGHESWTSACFLPNWHGMWSFALPSALTPSAVLDCQSGHLVYRLLMTQCFSPEGSSPPSP